MSDKNSFVANLLGGDVLPFQTLPSDKVTAGETIACSPLPKATAWLVVHGFYNVNELAPSNPGNRVAEVSCLGVGGNALDDFSKRCVLVRFVGEWITRSSLKKNVLSTADIMVYVPPVSQLPREELQVPSLGNDGGAADPAEETAMI